MQVTDYMRNRGTVREGQFGADVMPRLDAPATPPTPASGGGGGTNPAGAGSDPFAYTQGTLLKPWEKPFTYTPTAGVGGGGGGPAAPPPPGFSFGDVSYNFRDVGNYQGQGAFAPPEPAFAGSRLAAPTGFAPTADPSQINYNALTFDGSARGAAPGPITLDRYGNPATFNPNIDVTQDPSYGLRLKEGQAALERMAAARGTLRGTGTMQALLQYGQDYASTEYQNAWNRQAQAFGLNEGARQSAYDRNLAAQRGTYDIARSAYEGDRAFDLAAFDTNAQERRFGAQFGAQEQQRVNDTIYNRRASESDRAFEQGRVVDETNYARGASEADRRYSQSRDTYALNESSMLNAYQANAANAAAMGNLGMQSTFGQWDRNFQNYATSFNIDEARRNAAAAGGGGGLTEAQDYARQLQQYQMEYDIFRTNQSDQYARLMGLAGLGQSSAAQLGSFGANYGAQYGSNVAAGANANAASTVAGANAWSGAVQNATNTGLSLAQMAMIMQSPAYQSGSRAA